MRVLETERTSSRNVSITAYIQPRGVNFEIKRHFPKTLWDFVGPRKMARLNQRVGGALTKELVRETEGLGGEYSWDRRSSWTKYRWGTGKDEMILIVHKTSTIHLLASTLCVQRGRRLGVDEVLVSQERKKECIWTYVPQAAPSGEGRLAISVRPLHFVGGCSLARLRGNPGTVTIPQYRVNKTKQHTWVEICHEFTLTIHTVYTHTRHIIDTNRNAM